MFIAFRVELSRNSNIVIKRIVSRENNSELIDILDRVERRLLLYFTLIGVIPLVFSASLRGINAL